MVDDLEFGGKIVTVILTHHLQNPKRRNESKPPVPLKKVYEAVKRVGWCLKRGKGVCRCQEGGTGFSYGEEGYVAVVKEEEGCIATVGTPTLDVDEFGMHEMTDKEYKEYSRQIKESKGFDVMDFPKSFACGKIMPIINLNYHANHLKSLSELALKEYNEKEKTKLEFVKLVKANLEPCEGFQYYITFDVKDADAVDGPILTFQALVWDGIDEIEVVLCRLEITGLVVRFLEALDLPTRNCRGQRTLSRSLFSSSASRNEVVVEKSHTSQDEEHQDGNGEDDDLKSRIFRLRLPKRSASNVLQKWVSEGRKITTSDLRRISGDLRKSRRYKHALEDEGTRDFNGEHDDLKSRISRLYLPRVGTSNILQKWVSEGRKLTSSDLRHIRDHLHRRPLFCDRHAFEVQPECNGSKIQPKRSQPSSSNVHVHQEDMNESRTIRLAQVSKLQPHDNSHLVEPSKGTVMECTLQEIACLGFIQGKTLPNQSLLQHYCLRDE
ncbi:hypothetical protein TEA_024172 [Camellia sinensis var. sinensis]|uniref:Cystatin domain-containing protein n=1 Tax=Camellia sinensis var. sinensis TaxID=542762 RepID=A0A4S4DMB7_CAMSN|nr:hypothetical protein TEA_024172 [Camellia sinensis var. sinensis]